MIKVIYNKTCGRCVQSEPITSGMVGQPIELEYSADFDGLTLTAVLTNGKTTVDVLNPGAQCVIPHEVLDTVGTLVKVGIYAVRGNELVIPTVYADIGVVLKGADPSGDVSIDPTLPVWAQTQAMIGNLNDLNTETKDNLVAAINEAAQSGGGGGSTVELDTTLSETGKAADAKAVGDALAGKQNTISDLEAIRSGASKGATALQSVPSTYRTANEQDTIDKGKVDKVTGKGLSSNDYTDTDKAKVDSLATVATSGSYDDLADKPAPLIGTINTVTPTQVYNAVSAGIPVKIQYPGSKYGLLSFTTFNIAESMNLIVSQTIVYANGLYILVELFGDKSDNGWGFNDTTLAEKTDIPSALPNPNALTFTGAVEATYDGSAPVSVEIPSGGGGSGSDISLGLTGATVGQIAKITAVDASGAPTAWEPVDMPTGGSESTFEKVVEMTTAEDSAVISISTDKNGNPLSMSEFYVAITTSKNSTATANKYFSCNVLPDTVQTYIRSASAIKSVNFFPDVYCYVMHYKVMGGMIFYEYVGRLRTRNSLNAAEYLENEKGIGIGVSSGQTTGFLSPLVTGSGVSKVDSTGKMYCITFEADSIECIFGAGTRVEVWAR